MSDIQAFVRYRIQGEEKTAECYSLAEIEHLRDVDCIRKITFYNQAIDEIYNKFRGLPYRVQVARRYLTYTGDMAQFIIYNW